ncbi:hypothetical protein [Pseudarthrobacter sp. Y6]|uniref:hypothetical protein n=1 Tax=Pseudarthrobacter sp. Y6 TaxID=3418422 RepID=UPI003CEA6496
MHVAGSGFEDGVERGAGVSGDGVGFSGTAAQVLNIAYLNPEQVTSGGFFPAGVNGSINTSGDNDAD